MADTTIRTLRIKLDADGTLVVSGVESAKRKFNELGQTSQTVSQRMQAHWKTFKDHWLEVTAGVTAGILAMRKAWDLAKQAAEFEEQRAAVAALGRQWGMTSDAILVGIDKASRGLTSMKEAADIAARSLAMGFSPEQIFRLTEIAERFTDVIGGDVVDATNKMAKAVATGETEALKTIGISIRLEDVYKREAAALGLKTDQLSQAQRSHALYNETIAQTAPIIEEMGAAIDSNLDKMTRAEKQWANFGLGIGEFFVRLRSAVAAALDFGAAHISKFLALMLKPLVMIQKALVSMGFSFQTDLTAIYAQANESSEKFMESFQENWKAVWASNDEAAQNFHRRIEDEGKKIKSKLIPEPEGDEFEPFRAEFLAYMNDREYAEAQAMFRLKELDAEWASERFEIERKMWEQRVEIMSNALGSMATLFQTLSNIQGEQQGAAFALFKAFAIAQAVIDTHAAYMRALATLPPPFSYIAAAAAVAAGIARVAAIASTQPGTGVTAVASSVGPGTLGVNPPAGQITGGSSGPTVFNFNINAAVADQDSMDRWARRWAPSFVRASRDGVKFS